MKPTAYIETSIISYYTARPSRNIIMAGHQQITRKWWDKYQTKFDITISVLVLEEAKGGDPNAVKKRLDAVKKFPVLEISDPAEFLASDLIKLGAIPIKYPEDALHIALAAVNGIDFLLTWNFKHINNAQMKFKIRKIIEKHGYECPVICTPEEF